MSNCSCVNKNYTVKVFSKEKLSTIISGLSFDEAYKKAVPEEALSQYPGNYWHVKMKHAVFEDMNNQNPVLVSYIQNPYTNVISRNIYIYKD
jgi:hypothetical protein